MARRSGIRRRRHTPVQCRQRAGVLQAALGRLFCAGVLNANPGPQGGQWNFLTRKASLAEIEDQLQMARRYYNGTARDFSTQQESFPDVVFAERCSASSRTQFRDRGRGELGRAAGSVRCEAFVSDRIASSPQQFWRRHFAVAATTAQAVERILQFVSDVKVERNGDLLVITETIRVQAELREIRRGILRDFPTRYARRDGTRVEVGFDVQSVTRDGEEETFATE